MNTTTWKNCSSCKQPITLRSKYYVCSVSSCNVRNTNYVFCSIPCFDKHVPVERHKSAGAIEEVAPATLEAQNKHASAPNKQVAAPKGQRRIIGTQQSKPSNKQISKGGDILVIASRFKEFISQQSEFNTSASVMNALSDHLRHVAMQAIDNAREDGRRTVMEQDVKFLDKLNLNI